MGHSAAELAPSATTSLTAQRVYPNAKFGDAQLSLHHSGQTHVYAGPHRREFRLPPVQGARLDDPAGGHVATISWATLDGLPMPDRPLVFTGPNIDLVVPADPHAARMSVVLYSGTDQDAMEGRHSFLKNNPLLRMDRLGMPTPLHFGFRCRVIPGQRQDPPGVFVAGGWGPGASQEDAVPTAAVWVGL
ncbi:hypothetical protein AQI88_29680 [Streptomyces cellostaticus]|uniref:Uncharacterized protein n=2 Tax=Streptomyces cellostaticus TaxID=67285 RepID=A0A101NGR5_9ACTN|nr:hypothetical protein AQI88_29680 [Streptomyces cellostaticus]GHI04615.1 hypothetical protein Scel_29360 [Streptomyces cellostaticus]